MSLLPLQALVISRALLQPTSFVSIVCGPTLSNRKLQMLSRLQKLSCPESSIVSSVMEVGEILSIPVSEVSASF